MCDHAFPTGVVLAGAVRRRAGPWPLLCPRGFAASGVLQQPPPCSSSAGGAACGVTAAFAPATGPAAWRSRSASRAQGSAARLRADGLLCSPCGRAFPSRHSRERRSVTASWDWRAAAGNPELFPQPVGVDLAAVVRLLPWRLLDAQQRRQQGLRVHAHDLLLGEDLPDRFQQLQVMLLSSSLSPSIAAAWRARSGHLPPAASAMYEQAAPVVAGAVEQRGGMVTAGSSVRSAAQRANLRRHSMRIGL